MIRSFEIGGRIPQFMKKISALDIKEEHEWIEFSMEHNPSVFQNKLAIEILDKGKAQHREVLKIRKKMAEKYSEGGNQLAPGEKSDIQKYEDFSKRDSTSKGYLQLLDLQFRADLETMSQISLN